MSIRSSMMSALLIVGLAGVVWGQSNQKASRQPKFTELTEEDSTRLEQQRAVVAAAAKQRFGTTALTRTERDLPILQRLINDRVFKKSQTYELQCFGVAFGDVLASEFPLRWVMVTDEFGTDLTLRFKQTTIQINALTMISKRVERGEPVNFQWLVDKTREQLAVIKRNFADGSNSE
ncbi:MAG TPA: DUF3806 domain-containing protein [Terriglobales bacterium]|nr:DUF3806 domain-containing protein [Terriglobales bacterium]